MQGTYVCPFKMILQSSGFLLKHILECDIRNTVEIYKEIPIKSCHFFLLLSLALCLLEHDKISYGHSLCDLPGLMVSV